jgi:MFS family permease
MRTRPNLSLLAIIAEGLFSRLSFGIIGFALPLYARHLGLSYTQIGILVSLNSGVALCFKPMLGWVGDHFGLKRTFVTSIAMRSLVSLLLAFVTGPWALYAIRGLYGVSMSLRDPSANGLIAEHGAKRSVASAFAWYQTARQVAGSLSKALAGILLAISASNYSLVFVIAFAVSLFPVILVMMFVKEPAAEHTKPPHQGERAENLAVAMPRTSVLPFVGFGFLVAGTAEMLSGLFPVIATEYGHLTKAQAGLIYAISTLIAVLSGPVFGWLADNVSRKLTLLVRSVANTLSSALYLLWPSFLGMGMARTIDDVGKAAFRPAWGALMAQISGADRGSRARTMSWLSMGEDAGGVAAPLMAGFLWNTWGIVALMSARILLAIITELYAFAIEHRAQARVKAKPESLRVNEFASAP